MGRVDWFGNVYDGLLHALAIKGDFKIVEVGLAGTTNIMLHVFWFGYYM